MKLNTRKIIEESLPEDFRVWATQALVRPLNSFMADTTKLANGNILFGDNFNAQIIANQTISIPDDWLYISKDRAPAFQNSWINTDNTRTASFRIDHSGRVYTRGNVSGGSANSVIFKLPLNYPPAFDMTFACDNNNVHGAVTVRASGDVQQTAGNATSLSLDGIAFDSATRVPVPALVWPQLYKCTLNGSPVGVWIVNAVDQSNPRALNPLMSVDWEYVSKSDGAFIKVKNIPGLLPLRKYQFTLVAVAG